MSLVTLEDERQLVQRQTTRRSWTPADLDVRAPAGTAVHLSGDARWTWTHGTRLGVEVAGAPAGSVHDWWGKPEHVVMRAPERRSIVLAFAAKPDTDCDESSNRRSTVGR